MDDLLNEFYYTPDLPSSLGGARKLNEALRRKESEQEVRDWLSGEDAYTLHKQIKTKFRRRPTIVAGVGEQLQADLMDVRSHRAENDGITFLLTMIDVFSRKAWVEPLVNKSGILVAKALKKVLDGTNYRVFQTDKGKEFNNRDVKKVLKENKVKWFTSENETIKASIIERFNKTLRMKMYRFMTYSDERRYIDVLPQMVKAYNNTIHTTLGIKPNDVNYENQERIWNRIYENGEYSSDSTPKFNIDDYVRISKARTVFERGFTINWTVEVFQITEVLDFERPIIYKLRDLANEPVDGTFYEDELQKVKKPTFFRIEKILKSRKRGRTKEILVKWMGYPDSFNSWVNERDFVK